MTAATHEGFGDGRSARTLDLALFAIKLVLVLVFLDAGVHKLVGDRAMIDLFATIGLGQWFRYFTGALELVSAVLLLDSSTTFLGASALACVMIGAVATHVFLLLTSPLAPLVLLALSVVVAWTAHERAGRARRRNSP